MAGTVAAAGEYVCIVTLGEMTHTDVPPVLMVAGIPIQNRGGGKLHRAKVLLLHIYNTNC